MGVDFYCNEKHFGCSYSGWNTIRMFVLKATFNYLYDVISKDRNDELSEEEQEEETVKNLFTIKSIFENGAVSNVDKFIRNCNNNDYGLYLFTKYNANGIYALINKSDCEGKYSPGNALDICILLDAIKTYYDIESESNKVDYDVIYDQEYYAKNWGSKYVCVYKLFEESWKSGKHINIC